jgi:hypothetical protein
MVPQFCSRTATHTNWGWNRDYTVKLGPKRQGDFKDNSIIFFGWVRISFVFFCFFVFVFFLGSDLRELSVGNRFWTDCIFQFVFPARICFGFRRILLRKKKQGKQILLLVVTEAYLPPTQFHVVVERERKGARERERESLRMRWWWWWGRRRTHSGNSVGSCCKGIIAVVRYWWALDWAYIFFCSHHQSLRVESSKLQKKSFLCSSERFVKAY